jgi:riboflavin-specific deaminase-like protein
VASGVTSEAITAAVSQQGAAADAAWRLILGARALVDELAGENRRSLFGEGPGGQLQRLVGGAGVAQLIWEPEHGWQSRVPPADPRAPLLDLYLPICSATLDRPLTLGHLGQSLDGFIATPSGDSQFVTGPENLIHVHRLRALCDAVVVGAGTVAADDPQLTTRYVSGPSPLRVVLDPGQRLGPDFKVFTDRQAPTLYICADENRTSDAHGCADVVGIAGDDTDGGAAQVVELLRARGCARILVEGGGVTVSAFLEAGLLDRLQIAIAPVFIGDGRPAVRLTPERHLRDCRRPAYRVYLMGGDVLFDCDLRTGAPPEASSSQGPVTRIL